jgi:hypothetical protein
MPNRLGRDESVCLPARDDTLLPVEEELHWIVFGLVGRPGTVADDVITHVRRVWSMNRVSASAVADLWITSAP